MSIPPSTPVKRLNRAHLTAQMAECVDFGEANWTLCQDIDATKRDRFELLSAYLDGEVTPEERRMVIDWMASDPKAKCLYNRLVRLRQGLREGCSSPYSDADAAVTQVFQSLNYRMRLVGMAGLGVLVLGMLSLLSGSMGHHQSIWRWASSRQSEYLEIALDQPAFPIPKAPTAAAVVDAHAPESSGMLPIDSEL
jgi:hypothetical protein